MQLQLNKPLYFITGIDTDCGKTYATGMLARELQRQGKSVVTQKLVQTGGDPLQLSEDILMHRKIQGTAPSEFDLRGTTCPQIFRLPSSPHLAAQQEGKELDLELITHCSHELQNHHDIVLLEGAGGIMVPLRRDYLTADFIAEQHLPTILVSSPRLGSLNHTLLTLEYARARGIDIAGVVYNLFAQSEPSIQRDTREMVQEHLTRHFPEAFLIDLPNMSSLETPIF